MTAAISWQHTAFKDSRHSRLPLRGSLIVKHWLESGAKYKLVNIAMALYPILLVPNCRLHERDPEVWARAQAGFL